MSNENYLVTSALPYVNASPHLGNIVGCVLPADVYSRYLRQRGNNVVYICGADEYGSCTELKAFEQGVTPRELCDNNITIHKQVYEWFGIDFSYFGRTSTENPRTDVWSHTEIAQDIFKKLAANNLLIEQESKQLYSPDMKTFLADRFVIGECPNCGYEKANGDQCDKCNHIYQATELNEPKAKLNPEYLLELRSTWHLYLDLEKLAPLIKDWFENNSNSWSKIAKAVTSSWLRDGLKPRCITRDLSWGTPVPDTEQFGTTYSGKVMYNWFDAPIGYISITEQSGCDWKDIWKHKDKWHYTQFFGIDNIPFHSLIFPATLFGTGEDWLQVNNIQAGYHLNYNGQKFSKSNNIGIFGTDAIESGIPADVWRFYLMFCRPETDNTEFTWESFSAVVNGELNNNIGNYILRVLKLINVQVDGVVPEINFMDEPDIDFIININKLLKKYHHHFEECQLRAALEIALKISHSCNGYINIKEPWKLFKTDPVRCGEIMGIMVHTISLLASLLTPFMPTIMSKLTNTIGYEWNNKIFSVDKLIGVKVGKPIQLFEKVTDDHIDKFRSRFG